MIVSNFFKKKETLVYILIIFLLFWLISLIIFLDNKRTDYYNEHNKNAYIVFENTYNKYETIKNISLIDSVILGIHTPTSPGGYNNIFANDKLSENEFIANLGTFFNEAIGDTVTLADYNIELNIVSKIDSFDNESYISEDLLKSLIEEEDNILYMVTLNDWSNLDKGISEINRLSLMGLNHIRVNGYFEDNNYDTRYYIFRTVLIGIITIGFYYVFSSFYVKELEKSYMYYCLGFTKRQLIGIGISKLLLLLIIAFIPFIILYSWIFF